VLIAGGGVAGLEAALALRELAGERVVVSVLEPNDRFEYKPMLVAEPFASGPSTSIELAPVLAQARAGHVLDSLAEVRVGERVAVTGTGRRLAYDSILVAIGGRPKEAVPGALTFGERAERAEFAELLRALGRPRARRIAFIVPPAISWPIAAYELALLTAAERAARRIEGVTLTVVTHEEAPLALLGPAASRLAAATLESAGVALRTGVAVESFDGGELRLAAPEVLPCDRAVALPRLAVPTIGGLPQDDDGFLLTEGQMRVLGAQAVWAAGDVTAFPVKHGGIAAQEAEIAARSIAAAAGIERDVPQFEPVLRAAMLTDHLPALVEARLGEPAGGTARVGRAAWPHGAKLAAPRLAVHIADALGAGGERSLVEGGEDESETEAAVRSLLVAADAAAEAGDPESALGWLQAVEQLDLVIPVAYVARRDEWRRRLAPGMAADPAADRLASRFATPDEAFSDLHRRVGWLREIERRTGGEMSEHMRRLERDIEHLRSLSRRTGVLPRHHGNA
jgi:sulfide:quinone oxidoreductase